MAKIEKILVLGITGMLGSSVYSYLLKNTKYNIAGTARNIKNTDFENNIFELDVSKDINSQFNSICKTFKPNYVINCIGIINKYCNSSDDKATINAIKINSEFPYLLADYFEINNPDTKIIQIATDCVYSGKEGNYSEASQHDAIDIYGKTKSLGEARYSNFLNIRCSIIGFEKTNKSSLLEWFLNHKTGDKVNGFSHHKWNGVTTLQFAEFCNFIIATNKFKELRDKNHVIHYCPNKAVSKYELLNLFQSVFNTNFEIIEVNDIGLPKDMTLISNYLHLEQQDMVQCLNTYKVFKNKRF